MIDSSAAKASTSSSSSSADQNPWFSVRRAFRNLQQQHFSGPQRKKRTSQKKSPEIRERCPDPFRSNDQICNAVSSQSETVDPSTIETFFECPLCMQFLPNENFLSLLTCHHRSCVACLKIYLQIEITEGRVGIACPECPEMLHPADIYRILDDEVLMKKYEDFMVRHVLVLDPDARWCPAPDCGYAVIATGHASCPKLECARPGCGTFFCYNCKQNWHPDQTCDAARAERSAIDPSLYPDPSKERGSQSVIKACPRCGSLIMKLEDGSCNHMTCAGCGAEFCWLCLREISDLHYLSPSGCTFWGKKPWSHKRKILWQLGMLIGAPVGISLIAGVAFPVIIIGLPILVARKLMAKCRHMAKRKRHLVVASGVIASTLVSPVLAAVAIGVGVPMLLAYVYGVVPISLCRDSCCTGHSQKSSSPDVEFDLKEVPSVSTANIHDGSSSSSAIATAAATTDDVFPSSPSSSVNLPICLLPAASMSRIEVKAEMSHDLVRHKEMSHQVKKNSWSESDCCATPAMSSASSTFTKIDAEDISSVERDLGKNCFDAVSLSDSSLNASLPGATCLSSATNVADCTGTSTSNESVHPRLLLPRRSNKGFTVSAHSPPCGSTASSHVKAFKRQSMSVGDSIDERVESECGYLSLHSLAEEEVCLESFSGGSDIVTMVAVSKEMPDVSCNTRPPAKCRAAAAAESKANLNELKKLSDAEIKLQTMTDLDLPQKEASLKCDGSLEIQDVKEYDKHL